MERITTRAFGLAFAANLLMGLTFALFIHFAGFLVELGATEATIGIIIGFGSVGSLLVRPYVGQLMDKIGRRPLIHAGNVINLLSLVALTTVSSISLWLYVLVFVHGVVEAVLFSAIITYVADIVPESRRTEGMALFGVSAQLPLALGGLLGDFVLRSYSYDTLFWVASCLAGAALFTGLPLAESRSASTRPTRGFLVAVRQRDLSPIWLITAAFSLTLISIFTFLKTYIDTSGNGSVGIFFSIYSTVAIAIRLGARQLPAKFGELPVLTVSLMVMSAGMVTLGFATSTWMIAVAGATAGLGHGFTFPILNSLVVARSTAEERGSALSGFLSFFPLAALLGAPILGWIIQTFGYTAMYTTVAAQLFIVAVGHSRWEQRRSKTLSAADSR